MVEFILLIAALIAVAYAMVRLDRVGALESTVPVIMLVAIVLILFAAGALMRFIAHV